jgi:hypothetical protein
MMAIGMADIMALGRETLRDPRSAAARLVALDLPMQVIWMALALVVVSSILLTQVMLGVVPAPAGSPWGQVMQQPLRGVGIQAVFLVSIAAGIAYLGRLFGGRATFPDALLLVIWTEFILLGAQLAQLVALLTIPVVGLVIGILSLVLFFWLIVHFTAYLNGFQSLGKVFAGVIIAMFAVAFVAMFVLIIFGIVPPSVLTAEVPG